MENKTNTKRFRFLFSKYLYLLSIQCLANFIKMYFIVYMNVKKKHKFQNIWLLWINREDISYSQTSPKPCYGFQRDLTELLRNLKKLSACSRTWNMYIREEPQRFNSSSFAYWAVFSKDRVEFTQDKPNTLQLLNYDLIWQRVYIS